MTTMRAKVRVTGVTKGETVEQVRFSAVARNGSYPTDGSDEDNTYAKFSPQAEFAITIANPALLGQFESGQSFYVDFHPVPPAGAADEHADTRARIRLAALQTRVDELQAQVDKLTTPPVVEGVESLEACLESLSTGHVVVLPSDLKPGDSINVSIHKADAQGGAQ